MIIIGQSSIIGGKDKMGTDNILGKEEIFRLTTTSRLSRIQLLRKQEKDFFLSPPVEDKYSQSGYGIVGKQVYCAIFRGGSRNTQAVTAEIAYGHEPLGFYEYELGTPEYSALAKMLSTNNSAESNGPKEELAKIISREVVVKKSLEKLRKMNGIDPFKIAQNRRFVNFGESVLVGSIGTYLVYIKRDADCQDEDPFYDFHIYDGDIPIIRSEDSIGGGFGLHDRFDFVFRQKKAYPYASYADKNFKKSQLKYQILRNKIKQEGIERARTVLAKQDET